MKRSTATVLFVAGLLALSSRSRAQNRSIDVDAQAARGPLNRFLNTCVGAGRANEGLRADWQRQLPEVKWDMDFKYIRLHGLLTDDMGVYRVDREGQERYSFQYIDVLYDYIPQKLKQVGDAAQSMSYWVFTDIFEEPGPRFEAFHGGLGLMNTQGIKKLAGTAHEGAGGSARGRSNRPRVQGRREHRG